MRSDNKHNVARRLSRISGQARGLERMVEDDRYCIDVLLQIAAARAALSKVGKIILEDHLETCVTRAMSDGNQRARRASLDELMQVFEKFGAG